MGTFSGLRKDNPVWDSCDLTGIKTELQVQGDLSIVTVTVGVKNSGKEAVTAFLVPLQPTSADFGFDTEAQAYETLVLRVGAIGAGQEVQAQGEFTVPGKPKTLWVGVRL
jgi:hypothetical protein